MPAPPTTLLCTMHGGDTYSCNTVPAHICGYSCDRTPPHHHSLSIFDPRKSNALNRRLSSRSLRRFAVSGPKYTTPPSVTKRGPRNVSLRNIVHPHRKYTFVAGLTKALPTNKCCLAQKPRPWKIGLSGVALTPPGPYIRYLVIYQPLYIPDG